MAISQIHSGIVFTSAKIGEIQLGSENNLVHDRIEAYARNH